MKKIRVVEWAPAYGISIQSARFLTDEEKKDYRADVRDFILVGLGEAIELDHLTHDDLMTVISEDAYMGEFNGCSNMVYKLAADQEKALIALNEKRAKEKAEKEKRERIEAYKTLVKNVEENKVKVLPRNKLKKYLEDYNNLHNEGGEGYLPEVVAEEYYIEVKAYLQQTEFPHEGESR